MVAGLLLIIVRSFAQPCPTHDIIITDQEALDSFSIKYPNCTTILGNLSVNGEDITDLSGFDHIEKIYGYLGIGNTHVSELAGFTKLQVVWGNISIWGNDSLRNLTGFLPTLDTIWSNLNIYNNQSLNSLEGLEHIVVVQDRLHIGWPDDEFNQPDLKNLNGLSSLKKVGTLYLRDLAIESLEGLDSIQHIESIRFSGLENLRQISSLKNCEITEEIFLNRASKLESLDGLQGVRSLSHSLRLHSLHQIMDLQPLELVDLAQANTIKISYNSNLSDCAVESICQAIELNKNVDFSNNFQNCASTQEVANQCTSNGQVASIEELSLYPNPATEHIHLSLDNLSYRILDTTGKEVQKGTVTNRRIGLESLHSGIYFLQAFESGTVFMTKFVKN